MDIAATHGSFEQLADLICEFGRRIAELERQVAALGKGTPPHLKGVERRMEFRPTINGQVAGPIERQ